MKMTFRWVLVLGTIATMAGCGSSSSNATKADVTLSTTAPTTTSTTTIATTTTTPPATMTAAQIEAQIKAFYVTYANRQLNVKAPNTEVKQLEQKYFDEQLINQIDKQSPTIDYDAIECAQNSSNDVSVKVTRLSEGTFDATVTVKYSTSNQVIPVTGAADSGKLHTIKCS